MCVPWMVSSSIEIRHINFRKEQVIGKEPRKPDTGKDADVKKFAKDPFIHFEETPRPPMDASWDETQQILRGEVGTLRGVVSHKADITWHIHCSLSVCSIKKRRMHMKKLKLISIAVLLSSSMACIGCNDRDDRSRNAPTNPQGPSGPTDPQKNNTAPR
jgi:hypothetical protein